MDSLSDFNPCSGAVEVPMPDDDAAFFVSHWDAMTGTANAYGEVRLL